MAATPTKIVLAVDDDEMVLKSFRRILALDFDEVHVAASPAEAEEVLRAHPVTHLMCDFDLGEGLPVGTELITAWRGRYPGIAHAVIVSGSLASQITPTPGVDAVLSKPVSLSELTSAFGVRV